MHRRNVLVFVERRDGEIKRPSLEVAATGRRLASQLGGQVDAVALGPGAGDTARQLAPTGVRRLFAAEAEELDLYAAQAYAALLTDAAERSAARLLLLAGTALGRDLGPRAAARLRSACASDLIEIDASQDGVVRGRRPVYSGKALATIALRVETPPVVATLRPNVFPIVADRTSEALEVITLERPSSPEEWGVRTVRVAQTPRQELDVAEASIVVSGGRGLKEAANFALVRQLAEALGAAVGASRAVVDAGWIPHAHQVGQTGKVVSPNLYVACGISGAVQHLAGMSSSRVVVAINKDRDAPIFKIADYGLVGDLFEIVPALITAVLKLKNA